MIDVLYLVFKNIKRLRKIPDQCIIASVTPFYKKGDKRLNTNYRQVFVLNISSNILHEYQLNINSNGKCMYEPIYERFEKHWSKHKHSFVRSRSVTKNMLSFQQKIYEAVDKNTSDYIVTFYSDFSKAFDKVPHTELLIKVGQIGVGRCFL